MTAEQLGELMGKVEPDYWQYSSAEGRRVWLSPEINRRSAYARMGMLERRLYSEYAISSLVSSVLAAERVIDLLDAVAMANPEMQEALTAYREASK